MLSQGMKFHVLQATLLTVSYLPLAALFKYVPLYDSLVLYPSILFASLLVCSIHMKSVSRLSIYQKHCWKFLMWAWHWNWRPWPIQWIFWVARYFWCSRFDKPLHNGSTCIATRLIHCGGQKCLQVIHDQRIWGGLLPNFLFAVTRENKFWCRLHPWLIHYFFILGLWGFLWSWE